MEPLAKKYSRRNGPGRGSLIIVASALGVALENARLVVRKLVVERRRKHRKHTGSGSSSLSLAGADLRIIIVVKAILCLSVKSQALEVPLRLP